MDSLNKVFGIENKTKNVIYEAINRLNLGSAESSVFHFHTKMHRVVVLSVSYRYEILTVTLRDEHRLRVF